jgi:hypothetical protein
MQTDGPGAESSLPDGSSPYRQRVRAQCQRRATSAGIARRPERWERWALFSACLRLATSSESGPARPCSGSGSMVTRKACRPRCLAPSGPSGHLPGERGGAAGGDDGFHAPSGPSGHLPGKRGGAADGDDGFHAPSGPSGHLPGKRGGVPPPSGPSGHLPGKRGGVPRPLRPIGPPPRQAGRSSTPVRPFGPPPRRAGRSSRWR